MNWKLTLDLCNLIHYLEENGFIDVSEEEAIIFLSTAYYWIETQCKTNIKFILVKVWRDIGWENEPSEEIIRYVTNNLEI